MAKRGRPRKNPPPPSVQKDTPSASVVRVNSSKKNLSHNVEGSVGVAVTANGVMNRASNVVAFGSGRPIAAGGSSGVSRRLQLLDSPIPEEPPLVEHNREISKGKKLSYITPTLKEGNPIACLKKDEIESETYKWKNAIILYVVVRSPSISFISTYTINQWSVSGDPEVFYHNEGYFIIQFKSMDDRN